MANIPSLVDMLKAGVHFGHQSNKWHPKMAPFIFGARNGIHIINLEKTQEMLATALQYIKELAAQNRTLLLVGTKEQARPIIRQYAMAMGVPHVTEHWIGGLLTNFHEIQTLLKKYHRLKQQKETGELAKYTKKEQNSMMKKLEKMEKTLGGVAGLERRPDAIFLVDIRTEKTAYREALQTNTKIIALCDTNVNPEAVTYPIPSNDDATKTIELMLQAIAAAYQEGRSQAVVNQPATTASQQSTGAENKPLTPRGAAPGTAFMSE